MHQLSDTRGNKSRIATEVEFDEELPDEGLAEVDEIKDRNLELVVLLLQDTVVLGDDGGGFVAGAVCEGGFKRIHN